MTNDRVINFALLGLGKLGTGFYKLWQERNLNFAKSSGYNLKLKKILIKHTDFKRPAFIDKDLITSNPDDIIKDEEIQIVIDAIGGIEPTYSIIKKLICAGKNIISANRMLLAAKMNELAELANKHSVYIFPEPSLGGGIPIISTIQKDLIANKIHSVVGIMSGTSNYILTQMTEKKISFEEVLKTKKIQELGETLSFVDYEGADAAQKTSILAAAAFGININFLNLFAEGISNVTLEDINYAADYGYEIKLLAIIKEHEQNFEVRVHPTLVPHNHPLNAAKSEYNAYYIQTDLLGEYMILGKGVGIDAACSLLISDLQALTEKMIYSKFNHKYNPSWNKKPLLPMLDLESSYYARFPCADKPGAFGKITSVLGSYNINIGSAHADISTDLPKNSAYIHLFVNKAREKDFLRAIRFISKLDFLSGDIKYFRILDRSDQTS
jgi:homoserine dehydrogenase